MCHKIRCDGNLKRFLVLGELNKSNLKLFDFSRFLKYGGCMYHAPSDHHATLQWRSRQSRPPCSSCSRQGQALDHTRVGEYYWPGSTSTSDQCGGGVANGEWPPCPVHTARSVRPIVRGKALP